MTTTTYVIGQTLISVLQDCSPGFSLLLFFLPQNNIFEQLALSTLGLTASFCSSEESRTRSKEETESAAEASCTGGCDCREELSVSCLASSEEPGSLLHAHKGRLTDGNGLQETVQNDSEDTGETLFLRNSDLHTELDGESGSQVPDVH